MVSYFYGPDTYQARQAIDAVARETGARLAWVDRDAFERTGNVEAIVRPEVGLFGATLTVVRDPSRLPGSLQARLLAEMAQLPTAACILWDRGAAVKRSLVFARLGKGARVFSPPPVPELTAWLTAQARARGASLSEAAARLLVEHLGADRWRLLNQLEVLTLTSTSVTVEVVQQAVPASERAEIFSMLRALAAGKRVVAVRQLLLLLAAGEGEFYILAMLAYQFRTLLQIREGIDQGWDVARIVSESGIKPYVVQKNYPYAQRFSTTFLRDALTRILATDFAIRRGRVDQRTAVTMLVMALH